MTEDKFYLRIHLKKKILLVIFENTIMMFESLIIYVVPFLSRFFFLKKIFMMDYFPNTFLPEFILYVFNTMTASLKERSLL